MKPQIYTVLAALLLSGCSNELENSPTEGVEPSMDPETVTQPQRGGTNTNSQANPARLQQSPPRLDDAGANTNASAASQSTPATFSKASEIIGADVQSGADETLGSIEEIRFSDDGRIASVGLSTGGILGIGDKQVSVPMAALERSPSGEGFTMAASAQRVQQAESGDMTGQAPPTAWGAETRQDRKIQPLSETAKEGAGAIGDQPLNDLRLDQSESKQPRISPEPEPQTSANTMPGVKKASAWAKTEVKSQTGETLGKVHDFVIELQSGRVAYALVALSDSGKQVAIPMEAFQHRNGGLILSVDKAALEAAPEYSPENPLPPQGAWGQEPRGPEHYSPELEAPDARDGREKLDVEFERLEVDDSSGQ